MKKWLIVLMGIGFVLGVVGLAAAADTTTVNVTLSVAEVDALAANSAVVLTVDTATAGSGLNDATDQTTYDITTNAANRKITGMIDVAPPANTTLTVEMAAPSGASSAGPVLLGTSAQDLVTGISKASGSSLQVDWTFHADLTATPGDVSRTVTFTLTNM